MCLYLYWWTISLDCIILSLTWFIRYLSFYYYHCVYTSTGGLLVLIVTSSQWHDSLDISVLLLSLCLYLYWWTISLDCIILSMTWFIRYLCFYWWTISLDCIILSVTRFIIYLCFYYYHCVYNSTGGLLVLIVSSSHWHGLLDISVFITITVSIPLLVDY